MTVCRPVIVHLLVVLVHLACCSQYNVRAAITSLGDVNPAPPTGGGNVAGVLRVGNTALGTMDVAGGSGLTQSGEAIVGGTASGIGIVTLSGRNSNWILTNNSADMRVGVSGVGSVFVENLARVEVPDETLLGESATGVGEISIHGLGTIWNSDELVAGQAGLGMVNVVGGGRLATGPGILGSGATGEGRVVIADALSQWMVDGGVTVGAAGRGTVTILDGGMLRTTSLSTIGNSPSSVGTVEVNGPGALWAATDGATIGSGGTGKLYVFNGGRASFENALMLASSSDARAEIWVDGFDSVLTANSFTLTVRSGEADILISDGGSITTGEFNLGPRGRVTLDGGRLAFSQGSANLGIIRGTGTIATTTFVNSQGGAANGRVLVGPGDHLRLTWGLNNSGLIDVDGGELEVAGHTNNSSDLAARNGATLRFGESGLANNNFGQLAITAGEVDVFGNVANNDGGQILVGSGATAVFHDRLTHNHGQLIVMSGGTLLALEELALPSGTADLHVQLGQNDASGGVPRIQSADTITFGPSLTATLTDGYQPQAGDMFPLIYSATELSGTLHNENLPQLAAGLSWETIRTANSLSLLVVENSIAGDFDGDGNVDGRDFLTWQRNPGEFSLADWQENYGSPSPVGTSRAVPEPTTAVLLCTALLALVGRGYRE